MDVDFVAGIHKFIGQATFTTQAAFRSSISSKVLAIVLFKINVLIFVTLTVNSKSQCNYMQYGRLLVRTVSLAKPFRIERIYLFLRLV